MIDWQCCRIQTVSSASGTALDFVVWALVTVGEVAALKESV